MKKFIIYMALIFIMSVTTISCKNKAERLAKAKELLNRRCSKCHFSDRIYKKKYTKADWENIVKRMVSLSKQNPQGAKIEISHEDAYEILLLLQEESGD